MEKPERHQIEKVLFAKSPLLPDNFGQDGVTWTDRGKPYLPGIKNVSLSCTHDPKLMVCSAGEAGNGVDVEPVTRRERDEWDLMLGQGRKPAVESLVEAGDSYDRAATRVWCAMEALRKASDTRDVRFSYAKSIGDCAIFRGEDGMVVLAFPVTLLRGPERVFAIATQEKPVPIGYIPNIYRPSRE